ncbi:hypothetical protein ACP4OV_012668 [Aristida adscensionis]
MSTAAACMPVAPPSRPSPPLRGPPADEEIKHAGGEVDNIATRIAAGSHAGEDDGAREVGVLTPRVVVRTVTCRRKVYKEGFAFWRTIGGPDLENLDPFLSFDEFEFSPPAGFPDHPHRGSESVTYMLEGRVNYHDFSGHKGTINTGDVQWMTAGRGVVHAEMPGGDGVQRGINIGINLASKDKMVEPRYQDLVSHDIPTAGDAGGVSVKVIVGECLGVHSPIQPRTSAMCLDVDLRPGARLRQPVPRGWSVCAYVIAGEAAFGGGDGGEASTATFLAGARTLVVFGSDGDGVDVWAEEAPTTAAVTGARILLVAAQPHGEAVVQEGTFVMNTQEEVEQAREDYRHRRNGFEMADGWTSDHAAAAAAAR